MSVRIDLGLGVAEPDTGPPCLHGEQRWTLYVCPECGTESMECETHRREFADPPCPGIGNVARVEVVPAHLLDEAREALREITEAEQGYPWFQARAREALSK